MKLLFILRLVCANGSDHNRRCAIGNSGAERGPHQRLGPEGLRRSKHLQPTHLQSAKGFCDSA